MTCDDRRTGRAGARAAGEPASDRRADRDLQRMHSGEAESDELGVDADGRDHKFDRPCDSAPARRARRPRTDAAWHGNLADPPGRRPGYLRSAGQCGKRPASEAESYGQDAAGHQRDPGRLGQPAPGTWPAVFWRRSAPRQQTGPLRADLPRSGLAGTARAGLVRHEVPADLPPPSAWAPAGRVAFLTPTMLSRTPAPAKMSQGRSAPPGRGAVPP